MNTTGFESYERDGCGRCDKFRTPACKVLRWTPIIRGLRALALEAGLAETMKWGSPCYTFDGKNVVMIAAFEDSCALSFFKGSLLEDRSDVLESAGPNSRVARLVRFRSPEDFETKRAAVAKAIDAAIDAERRGAKVEKSTDAEVLPVELVAVLKADAGLGRAFDALTPGRKRSHVLHVMGAKQSATRTSRAEKCAAKILAGKGWNER